MGVGDRRTWVPRTPKLADLPSLSSRLISSWVRA